MEVILCAYHYNKMTQKFGINLILFVKLIDMIWVCPVWNRKRLHLYLVPLISPYYPQN